LLYNFPFKIDGRGHSAEVNDEGHIQQLIEQVLFTILGERVNRPTLGTRINQLVFAPNSEELATSTQFLIQGALQQWLGDIIHVFAVETKSEDSKLHISVQYLIRQNQQTHVIQFIKEV
jgi:uncharacterized protein